MTARNATARELVEELAAVAEALTKAPAYRSAVAMQHHRREVIRLVRRLEKRTRPKAPPAPKLPGQGTVAWHVLMLLEANRRAYDHDHVRMLTGLTDAEVAVRIIVPGSRGGGSANSTRPRRVELVRAGLVEAFATDSAGTRWTISELGRDLLAEAVRCAG